MAYKLPVQPALAVCMQLSTPDDIDDATKMFVRNINIAAESSTCGQRPNSPSDPAHALLKPEVLDLVRLKRTRGTLLKQTCAAQESQESACLIPVL